ITAAPDRGSAGAGPAVGECPAARGHHSAARAPSRSGQPEQDSRHRPGAAGAPDGSTTLHDSKMSARNSEATPGSLLNDHLYRSLVTPPTSAWMKPGRRRINGACAAELHVLVRRQSCRSSETHYPDRP